MATINTLTGWVNKFLKKEELLDNEKTAARTLIGASPDLTAGPIRSTNGTSSVHSSFGIAQVTGLQGALDGKLPTVNPHIPLGGTCDTPPSDDNTQRVANTTWVNNYGASTENILNKLKGTAGNATRIGAEYMPETIEGVFELADATGTVIADNQIANVNGFPAVGDGSTLEGNLLGQRIVRATGSKTAVQLQSAVFEKLVSIPVSGERLQNQSTLWMEIAATLAFSDVNFPQTPLIYVTLTDYTGFVPFASVSELSNLSALLGFGSFPLAHTVFQATGQIACNIQFVAATPPFVTLDKYRIRQNAAYPQGGVITNGTLGDASAFGLENNGVGNVATASKAPSTAEDCMLSFYLGIPASAGETRTLNYSITVKAEW